MDKGLDEKQINRKTLLYLSITTSSLTFFILHMHVISIVDHQYWLLTSSVITQNLLISETKPSKVRIIYWSKGEVLLLAHSL